MKKASMPIPMLYIVILMKTITTSIHFFIAGPNISWQSLTDIRGMSDNLDINTIIIMCVPLINTFVSSCMTRL